MWLGKLANCMGRETPVGMRLICPGGLKQNSCNTDLLKKINHHLLPHQKNPEKQKSTTLIQAAECWSEEFSLCVSSCVMSLDVEKPKWAVSTSTCDRGQSVSEKSVQAVARCLKIILYSLDSLFLVCLRHTPVLFPCCCCVGVNVNWEFRMAKKRLYRTAFQ